MRRRVCPGDAMPAALLLAQRLLPHVSNDLSDGEIVVIAMERLVWSLLGIQKAVDVRRETASTYLKSLRSWYERPGVGGGSW